MPATTSVQTTATTTTAAEVSSSTSGDVAKDAVAGDALSTGWFADDGAYAPIALWAALCSLLAFGEFRISRRFRNHAVGVAAVFIPFTVALYFLYQNINRLLPAGL